ncbi:transposase family protein [Paenibacillus sp. LHD-38]|uniref:transposase family protein n=1 Tax=Paenibacillus sp. LHD-38 TaxID=3072143 RepID=UPI00280EDCC3|nr:transposase family protein [Paenibacillus sp. LHD-38]MDQ8737159.1 transposase family protein [Paenibacillus sp. LHD-38]
MQIQYINEMLNIPELTIHQILLMSADEIHIEVKPLAPKQCCPVCHSDEFVTLKGRNGMRTVRHLPAFEKNVYLLVPSIRMHCSQCHLGFVWVYDFVGAKRRYSKLFRERTVEQALGYTAVLSARMQETPASTVQRMHNEAVPLESERLSERAWKQATESTGLVLGVDDFAIKKGHTYNTGFHDLRGGTLLDILPGRKLEELRAYALQHSGFSTPSSFHAKPRQLQSRHFSRMQSQTYSELNRQAMILRLSQNSLGVCWLNRAFVCVESTMIALLLMSSFSNAISTVF